MRATRDAPERSKFLNICKWQCMENLNWDKYSKPDLPSVRQHSHNEIAFSKTLSMSLHWKCFVNIQIETVCWKHRLFPKKQQGNRVRAGLSAGVSMWTINQVLFWKHTLIVTDQYKIPLQINVPVKSLYLILLYPNPPGPLGFSLELCYGLS